MKGITLALSGWLLLAAPVSVHAQSGSGDNFAYTINSGNTNTITVTNYTGPAGAVVVPTNINNLTVTAIGDGEDSVFAGTGATSVTIPGSVTSIEYFAFSSCGSLTNVTMPGSVINIENGAFQLCTSLTSVTIPGSVTSIGGSAFLDCTNLVSVTIPTSVTNIGEFAFEYCGLTNITIPGSVRSINVGVFAWCIALTNVTINQGVKSIGGFDTGAFESCTSLASVTFPNSLTNIGDYAFRTCTSLTSVLIPGSVTSIGILTFSGCTSLTSVYFTGNAPGVGADDDAFFEDNNVTTYYLPGMSGWSLTFWGYPSSGPPAVPWDPQIQASGANFGVQTNQFGFNLNWAAGQVIVVEACTNLASPVWVPLQTNTLVNGTLHFTDPGWTNYCARFYRITSP